MTGFRTASAQAKDPHLRGRMIKDFHPLKMSEAEEKQEGAPMPRLVRMYRVALPLTGV